MNRFFKYYAIACQSLGTQVLTAFIAAVFAIKYGMLGGIIAGMIVPAFVALVAIFEVDEN